MQQHYFSSAQACAAQQLLQVFPEFKQIVYWQQLAAAQFSPHGLFKIQHEQYCVEIAQGAFLLKFYPPALNAEPQPPLLFTAHFEFNGHRAELLEEFFLQDVYFLTGERKAQHPLMLREKAQRFRALLAQEIFKWTASAEKVTAALQSLSLNHARYVDQLMQQHQLYELPMLQNYVLYQQALPANILACFHSMFHLNAAAEPDFLPLQPLMESYDDFCCSAASFLPAGMYRIMSLFFRERFNLQELMEHEDDLRLLYRHAQEQPNLLGFVRLMNREVWNRSDLLAKPHFFTLQPRIWQKKAAVQPLFDTSRTVNWLYKQSAPVLDWISQNVQQSSVRTAVSAMSFIDSQDFHPQIILAGLQYFQHISARLFIHCCHFIAVQDGWFEHPNNTEAVLEGTPQALDDHRLALRPSVLYLDEWMALAAAMAQHDPQALKKVYLRLSRVMQAYLQHLHQICAQLPLDVVEFMLPERQQDRDFYTVLQRHKMQIDEFRQRFYLQRGAVRKSLFDGYVRDFLGAYFAENKIVPKNVTWNGLFQQACSWHDLIQKEEILSKLKKDFSLASWRPVSPAACIYFEDWRFEELQSIERIIEESKRFRHCLASSYAQRIIEGDYAAFHMQHVQHVKQMTLGCIIQNGQLLFDQLELPNNEKAAEADMQSALRFIDHLNRQCLIVQKTAF